MDREWIVGGVDTERFWEGGGGGGGGCVVDLECILSAS